MLLLLLKLKKKRRKNFFQKSCFVQAHGGRKKNNNRQLSSICSLSLLFRYLSVYTLMRIFFFDIVMIKANKIIIG